MKGEAWISRAGALFGRCARKTNVAFCEEARGWLVLNRSGLSDEQKAVVLALLEDDSTQAPPMHLAFS